MGDIQFGTLHPDGYWPPTARSMSSESEREWQAGRLLSYLEGKR